MENSLIYQVEQLLSYNKVSFDKEELDFQIQSHPSYPSLHAVTGVLDHFGIDNLALDIPNTEEVYVQLPNTSLVQIATQEEKEFAVMVKKRNGLELIFSAKKRKKYTVSQFLELFTGIIVVIEKPEVSVEISSKTTLLTKGMYVVFGMLLLSLFLLSDLEFLKVTYLLLSVIGFLISVSLVKAHLGIESSLEDAFCAGTDTNKDCKTVIASKGSKIAGILNLTDISLVYFITLSVTALFAVINNSSFIYLFAVSILATPAVLYSICYQYFYAKSWCPLCLLVASILAIQGVIAGLDISEILNSTFELASLLILFTVAVGAAALWNMLAPKIDLYLSLKAIKIDFYKFKRNFGLFKSALDKSPKIHTTIANTSEIIFGNIHAPLSIVIITSPFCGHCKPVHEHVEEILKKHHDNVAITIRFKVFRQNEILFKITTRLTEIYHTNGNTVCLKAMHDIYSGMDEEVWMSTWGHCADTLLYGDTLEAQNDWCQDNNISFTPEILVSGKSFPKEYQRKDLLFFIEDLAASCLDKQQIPSMA